jgi:hypothetical protein
LQDVRHNLDRAIDAREANEEPPWVKKSQKKLVCMRGIRSDLWAQVRKMAKQEDYFSRAALAHELAAAAAGG